jgi:hypothetical protein
MDLYTDTILINLNSNNATLNNGSFLSDVQFNFIGLIKDDPDIIESRIQIQNAQIPFSFYNINVYNNVLKYSINGIPTIYTITLTRGNYNANTLITELQNEFITNSHTDITIAISSITGCLTITKTTGSLTLLYVDSTVLRVLGFLTTQDYTSTLGVLNAPFPLNLLGTLKLRIASDTLQTNNLDSSVGGSFNILATIPIESSNFGIILFDNIANTQSLLDNKYLDSFDIKIIDDDNNLINFNNISWSLSLLIHKVKKRTNSTNTDFKSIITPLFTALTNTDKPENTSNTNSNIDENNINDLIPVFDDTDDLDVLLYNNKGKI